MPGVDFFLVNRILIIKALGLPQVVYSASTYVIHVCKFEHLFCQFGASCFAALVIPDGIENTVKLKLLNFFGETREIK